MGKGENVLAVMVAIYLFCGSRKYLQITFTISTIHN